MDRKDSGQGSSSLNFVESEDSIQGFAERRFSECRFCRLQSVHEQHCHFCREDVIVDDCENDDFDCVDCDLVQKQCDSQNTCTPTPLVPSESHAGTLVQSGLDCQASFPRHHGARGVEPCADQGGVGRLCGVSEGRSSGVADGRIEATQQGCPQKGERDQVLGVPRHESHSLREDFRHVHTCGGGHPPEVHSHGRGEGRLWEAWGQDL